MTAEMITASAMLRDVVAGTLLCSFIAMWLWVYGASRGPALETASYDA